MDEDIDTLVRRADEDRWLASRFASEPVRARLMAIYAVNYEIARTSETVREIGIGLIRLAWWREALEEIAEGAPPRAHPVLVSYAAFMAEVAPPALAWDAMIEARALDFEPEPFGNWPEIDAYLNATAGNVMRLALAACGAAAPTEQVAAAAKAWGYVGLLRAHAIWMARGRSIFPRSGGSTAEMLQHAADALVETRAHLGAISSEAFPAIGYLALAPAYARTLKRGEPAMPLLARQLKLIAASATGRV